MDIITHGEKIADILGRVKTINPNLLASQLNKLSLSFEQGTIDGLANVARCTAIEGVEVSQEELEALREATAFNGLAQDDEDLMSHSAPANNSKLPAGRGNGPRGTAQSTMGLADAMAGMNLGGGRQPAAAK